MPTLLVILLGLALCLLWLGLRLRYLPGLKPWHTLRISGELRARDLRELDSFETYARREQELVEAHRDQLTTSIAFNRYHPGSLSCPVFTHPSLARREVVDRNLSFELEPEGEARSGTLLIHGLTDSPYSLEHLAKVFRDAGSNVLVLRLPGHGTSPRGLVEVGWRDWYAAVEFGMRALREKLRDRPLYLGGYSTGGALALRYCLEAAAGPLPLKEAKILPAGLFLFSPAIGVTEWALLSDVHRLYSWIPGFETYHWYDLKPEYDPCKYNSFPLHAGAQTHRLTRRNKRLLRSLRHRKLDFPPIQAFQSVVDATVQAEDLVWLFEEYSDRRSELVLFDVNHDIRVPGWHAPEAARELLQPEAEKAASTLLRMEGAFPAALSLLTNRSSGPDRARVRALHWEPGEATRQGLATLAGARELATETEQAWPDSIYSLSHVALPFAPEDPVYGRDSILHQIMPRGERGSLAVAPEDLARLRHNPFFDFQAQALQRRLEQLGRDSAAPSD